MKTLYLVAGARPNFMKIAPLVRALGANGASPGFKIMHTGQHYDHELNDVFFDEICVPAPDAFSRPDSGSQAQQRR
jgi:UDP-N-acetylglucosamine 2-epimerase (non-hydrolysing)